MHKDKKITDIKCKIEEKRKELDKAILTLHKSAEILALSKELDLLIEEYYELAE